MTLFQISNNKYKDIVNIVRPVCIFRYQWATVADNCDFFACAKGADGMAARLADRRAPLLC
jgi:hypothetical protein